MVPHLKKPSNLKANPQWTEVELKSMWSKVKEFESAGKCCLHFRHMKVFTQHDKLLQLETNLANYSYCNGAIPSRWKKGLNVTLEKKQGNFNVEKFCCTKLIIIC